MMEERERRVLEKHRRELVTNIVEVEPLLDYLISQGVLRANGEDVQRIRRGEIALARARNLLDILPSCGRAAFGHLVDALRLERPHLAELLERSLEDMHEVPCKVSELPQPRRPSHPTARKLQDALRTYHTNTARCLPLFDFHSGAEAVGLDEVFVTLSALNFSEIQSMFARQKELSAKELRELASKTWMERREDVEEITGVDRLLRFADGQVARSCLLLAQAAAGKTLTLLKLAALWAEGRHEALEEFEFVFYVSGRDSDALAGKSAIDVLQLGELDLSARQQEEMMEYLSEHSDKVLVLLDGADEGGELWTKSKGLEKIVRRKGGLANSSFIVASRPCEAANRLIPLCDQHFHLVGLSEQRLGELLVRRLGSAKGQEVFLELQQTKWSQLRALMKETPLVANMVAALVKSGQSLPATRTEIYTRMVVNMVKRSAEKLQSKSLAASLLPDLPPEEEASLLAIGKLALQGLKEGRYVFDLEKEVRPACGDAVERLGFVEEFRTVSVHGERHDVQFSHLTYQEYLAALCISQADDVNLELDSCQKEIGLGEETEPFWRFVGGLLGWSKVEALMTFLSGLPAIDQTRHPVKWLVFQMSCFAEAIQQPLPERTGQIAQARKCAQEASAAFLPDVVDLSCHQLDLSDMHSAAISLSHALHIRKIDVSSCELNSEQCDVLCIHRGLQHISSLSADRNPGLHGDGLKSLAKSLAHNGKVMKLAFAKCRLDDGDCVALQKIMYSNKSLYQLYLEGNSFSAAGLRHFTPAIQSSQLETLKLSECLADDEGAHVVGEILSGNTFLSHVYLNYSDVENTGVESVLIGAATATNLSKLTLLGNRVDDGVIPALSEMLQERESVRQAAASTNRKDLPPLEIHLHEYDISKMALDQLALQMPRASEDEVHCGASIVAKGKVTQRDLSGHFDQYAATGNKGDLNLHCLGIDEEGARQVASQLEGDRCCVEALKLYDNALGDDGAMVLSRALENNSTLHGLDLTFNNVGMSGFTAFSTVLVQANTSLRWLELGDNPIFSSHSIGGSPDPLEQLLTLSHGLQYLGLSYTDLSDNECEVISSALAANTGSITFLNLSHNQISDVGAATLFRALEQNTTVRFLDLSYNRISDDSTIAAAVQCAQTRRDRGVPLKCVWMAQEEDIDARQFSGCILNARFTNSNLSQAVATYLS